MGSTLTCTLLITRGSLTTAKVELREVLISQGDKGYSLDKYILYLMHMLPRATVVK